MKNRAFLCLGYPAVGKTTFFKNNGLHTLTLCGDTIAECLPYIIGPEMRPQYSPNWAKFRDWMLDDVTLKHADIIIDQPCYREKTLAVVYNRLLTAGYECYFIDFTVKDNGEKWTIEEIIENNKKRESDANILGNLLGLCLKKDFDYIRNTIQFYGDKIITKDEFLKMIHQDLEFVDLNEYEHVIISHGQHLTENDPKNFYVSIDDSSLLNCGTIVPSNVVNIIGARVLYETTKKETDVRQIFDTYFPFTFKGKKYIVAFQLHPIIPTVLNKLGWLDEREGVYDYRRIAKTFIQNNPDITYIHADRKDVFVTYDNIISLRDDDNPSKQITL